MNRTWYIVDRILLHSREVVLIERVGKDWFAFDGSEWNEEDIVQVDEADLLAWDPTIGDVLDLEDGFEASRENWRAPWTRGRTE